MNCIYSLQSLCMVGLFSNDGRISNFQLKGLVMWCSHNHMDQRVHMCVPSSGWQQRHSLVPLVTFHISAAGWWSVDHPHSLAAPPWSWIWRSSSSPSRDNPLQRLIMELDLWGWVLRRVLGCRQISRSFFSWRSVLNRFCSWVVDMVQHWLSPYTLLSCVVHQTIWIIWGSVSSKALQPQPIHEPGLTAAPGQLTLLMIRM